MVEHGRDFRLMLGPTAFQISVSPAGEAAFKDEVESGIPISGRASFFKRYPVRRFNVFPHEGRCGQSTPWRTKPIPGTR